MALQDLCNHNAPRIPYK